MSSTMSVSFITANPPRTTETRLADDPVGMVPGCAASRRRRRLTPAATTRSRTIDDTRKFSLTKSCSDCGRALPCAWG